MQRATCGDADEADDVGTQRPDNLGLFIDVAYVYMPTDSQSRYACSPA
jgi:hypothetical protein